MQQAARCRRLAAWGTYTPIIMIGVTCAIYKEFYDTMDLLGVSKAEAKRCAAVMHSIAVSYVDTITTTKWQQERRGVG
jgi:hypothetical protein